jgi:hypothetical protein
VTNEVGGNAQPGGHRTVFERTLPRPAEKRSVHGATGDLQGGLKIVVARSIQIGEPALHGVGRSARRPPQDPTGRLDDDVERVTNLESRLVQRSRKGGVFAESACRKSSDGPIGRHGYGQARARRDTMVRPRIMGSRITARDDFRY